VEIEHRLAIELIEVGANGRGLFQADAVVTDQIGDATRRIDAVVRTVRKARLGGNDVDPALQPFLDDHHAHDPRVR